MTNDLFAYLREVDLALFHFINGFAGRSLTLDEIANLVDSLQLKSLALMGTFGALWFQRSKTPVRQRETLILTLLGVVLRSFWPGALPISFRSARVPCTSPAFGRCCSTGWRTLRTGAASRATMRPCFFRSRPVSGWCRAAGAFCGPVSPSSRSRRAFIPASTIRAMFWPARSWASGPHLPQITRSRAHTSLRRLSPWSDEPRLLLLPVVSFHLRGVDDVHAYALAAPGDHAHSLRPRQLVDLRPAHAGLPDPHAELLAAETLFLTS
jgi:hypothetical protein